MTKFDYFGDLDDELEVIKGEGRLFEINLCILMRKKDTDRHLNSLKKEMMRYALHMATHC